MGRSPPLPHHPQRRRQRCAARAYYAGRSGLINTDKDDALLHYLTGHHPARNATTEPNEDEYQRIQRELSDWDWTEKGGRPPKRMPSDVARSVLTDVIETGNQVRRGPQVPGHLPLQPPLAEAGGRGRQSVGNGHPVTAGGTAMSAAPSESIRVRCRRSGQ